MIFPNKPRGTQDIYPPRSLIYQKIQQIITEILHKNNYRPIIFPTFEAKELFASSLGSTTDIIYKEMYTFADYTSVDIKDKKGRELSLRPEGTISTARLVCQNNLLREGYPLKLYYWANMFRYERPQKGRYREFWQLGVELINASGAMADYQILKLTADILEGLGISEFIFNLNYLGESKTKENYKRELVKFIEQNNPNLCDDCQRRYQTNPLRMLDCLTCQKVPFPTYEIVWDESNRNYIQMLNHLLHQFNFPHRYNYRLVRGLDYYTGLVFEVDLGTKKAILGGGRYDQLYQAAVSSRKVPAIGFAFGIERLIGYLENSQPSSPLLKITQKVDVFCLVSTAKFYHDILIWKKELNKHPWVFDYNLEVRDLNNFSKIFNYYKPHLLMILGIKEWESGEIMVKDCQKHTEFRIKKEEVVKWIDNYLK